MRCVVTFTYAALGYFSTVAWAAGLDTCTDSSSTRSLSARSYGSSTTLKTLGTQSIQTKATSTKSKAKSSSTQPQSTTSKVNPPAYHSSSTATSQTSTLKTSISPTSTLKTSTSKTSPSKTSTSSSSTTKTCPPSPTGTNCPAAWQSVVNDLAPLFRDAERNCTDMARAAIRYGFHDAAAYSNRTTPYLPASGGADGSLLLSSEEIQRSDNNGLRDYHANLTQKYKQYQGACYNIGAADLIQVAAWLGVIACPGGQLARVYVGRNDTNVAAPEGLLPQAFGPGSDHDTIYNLFQDKGFSAIDLASLMGAHSTSKASFETQNGIPSGTPQDTTPGQWDVLYYNETYHPVAGMKRFESDINLSDPSTTVGQRFQSFVGNQGFWASSFSNAYQIMSLLGIDFEATLTMPDCTDIVANAPFIS